MARITVVRAKFIDALDQDDPVSLNEEYPDGGQVNEFYLVDESADPLAILMAREAEELSYVTY